MGSAEDLFEGEPPALPAPMACRTALYVPGSGPAPQVKHVGGYGQFIGFCTKNGVRAEELAADPARLFWFLRTLGSELEGDARLKSAAAIFAGNTIAGLRPDSRWTAYEGGSPTVGNRRKQFEVERLLDALRDAEEAAVQGLIGVLAEWAQEDPDVSPPMHLLPDSPVAGQPRYMRPPLPAVTCYSDDGKSIPYGQQWGDGEPHSDSYGVDSHAERFAGLHSVALALIERLAAVYDVEVQDDRAHARDLLSEAQSVLQVVKVMPRLSKAAPLTFVLTGYPSVRVHAGVLHDFPFPVCGCDACDETAETTADRMERLVLTVVAGGYRERYPVGNQRWSEYALTAHDGSGSESGQGEPRPISSRRLLDGEVRLRNLAGAWRPWPLAGI
ncbi:MAG: hypothetical protein JWQ56_1754 [Pseudarthrobacter sp.]|nr:hypothetical protein [Pseudarthrobacter sp.]